jgi:hypothetical protein
MKNNFVSLVVSSLLSIIISFSLFIGVGHFSGLQNANAQSNDSTYKLTLWKSVNSSLSELLNSGWRIIAQSSHRVATVTTNGVGAIDQRTFVFTLSKNDKYITCFVTNPQVNEGGNSNCRLMN